MSRKHYSRLRMCFKCFAIEVFNEVEFVSRTMTRLIDRDVCTKCYPEIKSENVKKNYHRIKTGYDDK